MDTFCGGGEFNLCEFFLNFFFGGGGVGYVNY